MVIGKFDFIITLLVVVNLNKLLHSYVELVILVKSNVGQEYHCLSFLFCGKVLHCGDKKFGNFYLKGTFENNCLKNEKRSQTFLSHKIEKKKEKKSLE